MPLDNSGLDFEVDLTDLETFGETTAFKTPKMQKIQISSPTLSKTKRSGEHLVNTSSSSQEEVSTSLTDMDDPVTEETPQTVVNESIEPKTEQMRVHCAQESGEELPSIGDSDDEKLVIDDSVSPAKRQCMPKTTPGSADAPITPVSKSTPVNSESSSPKQRRRSKRAKVSDGDQLGEILRMQTAMFNSAGDTAKCSTVTQEINSPTRGSGPSTHSHPTSLVKPCVSSYLERNQAGETGVAPHESAPGNVITTEHKSQYQTDFYCVASKCVYLLN